MRNRFNSFFGKTFLTANLDNYTNKNTNFAPRVTWKIYRFNKTKEKTLEFCSCHLSVLIGIKYSSKIFVQSEKGKLENCFVIFPVRSKVISFIIANLEMAKNMHLQMWNNFALCYGKIVAIWIPSSNIYLLALTKAKRWILPKWVQVANIFLLQMTILFPFPNGNFVPFKVLP